jgi:hypothetical protein
MAVINMRLGVISDEDVSAVRAFVDLSQWTPQERQFGRPLDLFHPQGWPSTTSDFDDNLVIEVLEKRGFQVVEVGHSLDTWHLQVFPGKNELPPLPNFKPRQRTTWEQLREILRW